MDKNHYVYRHTKTISKEVFYIGIGSSDCYFRAYTPHGRNRFWYHVINKYDYDIEILSDRLSLEEACELEILLIDYYGRRNLGKGNLVNLTDGGEGALNILKTPESIEKWKKSNKGKQDGELNVMYGKTRGKHHLAKEVLHLETGIFYDCALDACENSTYSYSSFKSQLNGRSNNYSGFVYAEDYENNGLPEIKEHSLYKKVINTKTKEVFKSITDAAKSIEISPQILGTYLTGYCSNKTDFLFLSDYGKGLKPKEKRGCKKYVLNTEAGIYYESVKEASELLGIKYRTLINRLNPNTPTKNHTPLIYV